mgnify:CR=1 FL=1
MPDYVAQTLTSVVARRLTEALGVPVYGHQLWWNKRQQGDPRWGCTVTLQGRERKVVSYDTLRACEKGIHVTFDQLGDVEVTALHK